MEVSYREKVKDLVFFWLRGRDFLILEEEIEVVF